MKINFTNTERPLVYGLKLETAHSSNLFLQQLSQENWQVEAFKKVGWRSGGGRCTIDGVGRYNSKSNINSIRSHILKELFEYTLSDQFKSQWLTVMFEDPIFQKLWAADSVEQMASYTALQANYVLDNSMTKIALHLDNRLLLSTGMIYLNQTNELTAAQQATTFYTDQNRSDPLMINPQFGSGWAAANTHNSWHDGKNSSVHKRYSLLLGLTIDVGKLRAPI